MRDAQGIEEGAHHRALELEVVDDQQPGGEQVGHLRDAGQVLRPLVHRKGLHAARAELDLAGDERDGFRLFERGVLVGPEGGGAAVRRSADIVRHSLAGRMSSRLEGIGAPA
ncbi:MAG: hypothetical protein R2708_19975 [Vicinamibacterales bacterium]